MNSKTLNEIFGALGLGAFIGSCISALKIRKKRKELDSLIIQAEDQLKEAEQIKDDLTFTLVKAELAQKRAESTDEEFRKLINITNFVTEKTL